MDKNDLARAVAADLGGDIAAATEAELRGHQPPPTDDTRGLGLTEAMAAGSFLIHCAQLALDVWNARQDRALLLQALVDRAPDSPRLDMEKRLTWMGRIVDKLVPDRLSASPSLGPLTQRSKQQWVSDWLGFDSRAFTPTVLMPFADMDNFIVYQPISWSPPEPAPAGLPGLVTVPRGFVTDLATIPPYFWWALPPAGRHGHAAILHDWLYWAQPSPRDVADRVFSVAMEELGVPTAVRTAIWAAVRVYGGSYWTAASAERQRGGSRVLKKLPQSPTVVWAEWKHQPDVFA